MEAVSGRRGQDQDQADHVLLNNKTAGFGSADLSIFCYTEAVNITFHLIFFFFVLLADDGDKLSTP